MIEDPVKEHAQAMATIERVFERGKQAESDLRSLLATLMIPRNREMLEASDPRVREVLYEQLVEPIAERWKMK